MKNVKLWILFLVLIFLFVFIFLFKMEDKKAKSMPSLKLWGSRFLTINLGGDYKELGYKAYDSYDGDISSKVKVSGEINSKKEGTYELIYKVKNSSGVMAQDHRFIKVISKPYYKDSYDKIDNTTRGWWATNRKDGTRPSGGADINELKKYDAYYLGPDEKIIYLTFDEGALETYVKEIVDVLNANDVKATFFLCHTYMVSNKDLIKEMVKKGHLIGNHTVNHKSMPTLAVREKFDEYLSEIKTMEADYYKITGEDMVKVYRDPKGEWSYRDLQIMKDLGYRSYFYSAYYMDFGDDVSKERALNELTKRHHNGAIYLLHPKNKGNLEALESFIREMKDMGYRFDTVKNIP